MDRLGVKSPAEMVGTAVFSPSDAVYVPATIR
jgi:hypothetical protein